MRNLWKWVGAVVLASMLWGGIAFGVQTDSDVQTDSLTLEDVLAIIDINEALDDAQKTALGDAFTAVVEEEYLSVEEALTLLEVAGLESLTVEDAAFVIDALGLVLDAVYSGEIDPESAAGILTDAMASGSLNDIKEDLAEWTTPEGISNVIGRAAFAAGYTGDELKDLLDRANLLIADGVPPGIVVRTIKGKLNSGTESEEEDLTTEALSVLDEVYTYIVDEGLSPGQAANKAAGKGKYKHTEEEQEQNQNQHGNNGKGNEKGKGKGKAKGHDKKNDDDE